MRSMYWRSKSSGVTVACPPPMTTDESGQSRLHSRTHLFTMGTSGKPCVVRPITSGTKPRLAETFAPARVDAQVDQLHFTSFFLGDCREDLHDERFVYAEEDYVIEGRKQKQNAAYLAVRAQIEGIRRRYDVEVSMRGFHTRTIDRVWRGYIT